MARKQFVSSKKNAPSRAVSSKEAALHGRAADANGEHHDSSNDDGGDDDQSSAGSDSPGSPASSNGSSSLFTSDEQDELDAGNGDADGETTVDVEVMPASVGRGKQLRFPTVISRGKESRVFAPGTADDDDSDSDDSLLSINSDEEEEEEDKSSVDGFPIQQPKDAVMEDAGSVATTSKQEESPSYPIKGFRARKRHRPDSAYFTQMSTYVRDCLLSVRDGTESAGVLSEESHEEFRRKLSGGSVERVVWKEADTSAAAKHPSDSHSGRRKEDNPAQPVKKEKHKEEKHTKKERSKSRSNHSKPSSSSSSRKREDASSSSSSRLEPTAAGTATTASSSSKSSASQSNGSAASALCSSCKKKLSDDKEPEKPLPKKSVTIAPDAKPEPPFGSFTIPSVAGKDVAKLRADASKLNEEARALKHEGNRKGAAEPGAAGQIAQGKFYLRSSAKFFQHALKLADLKVAYKELGDERHARSYGDFCVTTLSQTSSLIESTIRTFQSAGSTRMVALGYKLASIVHLTIYRLQHLKLFSLYSDLFTPGRSPDTRQNGTPTPPIGGTNPDSKDAAVRSHLLKEMEHTLRGFEMWRRYESCRVVVLPRITNPAVTDLNVLFEDLHSELGLA